MGRFWAPSGANVSTMLAAISSHASAASRSPASRSPSSSAIATRAPVLRTAPVAASGRIRSEPFPHKQQGQTQSRPIAPLALGPLRPPTRRKGEGLARAAGHASAVRPGFVPEKSVGGGEGEIEKQVILAISPLFRLFGYQTPEGPRHPTAAGSGRRGASGRPRLGHRVLVFARPPVGPRGPRGAAWPTWGGGRPRQRWSACRAAP